MEKVDGSQFIERLAIFGTTSRSLSGLRFALDLSGVKQDRVGIVMSVFANKYPNDYPVWLLNEITGAGLIGELQPDEQRESESYCRYALKAFGRFPANDSIAQRGIGHRMHWIVFALRQLPEKIEQAKADVRAEAISFLS